MKIIQGKGVSSGIALGRVRMYIRDEINVMRINIDNPDAEYERYNAARLEAMAQLNALYKNALTEMGENNAMIFGVHCMMLEDPDYNNSVEGIIRRQSVNAEYAVAATADNFARMFAVMEDDYLRERASDVRDISRRVLKCLMHKQVQQMDANDSCVICAQDLAPSETVQFDKKKVLAFCTARGSSTSHTAILARTLGIPAVTGIGDELAELRDGDAIIVDGGTGRLYINPDELTYREMLHKLECAKHRTAYLSTLRGHDNITQDGHRVNLYANVSSLEDVAIALDNDCGGIGLFRSEFLYLDRGEAPTEEQQFLIYRQILERMEGKRVVIRTLDIGADKQYGCFTLAKEENPALGLRGIRFCLANPMLFKTQLRALFRASAYGWLAIMFPMIISVEEIRRIKEIITDVKDELRREHLPFREDVELGVMIETPAAVMISDLLAKEVDFFSVGSNDLTQYTLAVDRQNPEVEQYSDPRHVALLRMIRITCENAHKVGAWVGICGEVGADEELTEAFLAMGVDELSVTPTEILPLREKIRGLDLSRREKILSAIGVAW
ncbi:MAG: phosphoenolpyruvate--protein phosphotransferase [Ruminococcaceae bacterium]|nr:phosphoenolpyruvate--protein phosphotransferase [Oscillospiraceae bacterium]